MSTTPRELLDTSIAQLEMLRAFLGEQRGALVKHAHGRVAHQLAQIGAREPLHQRVTTKLFQHGVLDRRQCHAVTI